MAARLLVLAGLLAATLAGAEGAAPGGLLPAEDVEAADPGTVGKVVGEVVMAMDNTVQFLTNPNAEVSLRIALATIAGVGNEAVTVVLAMGPIQTEADSDQPPDSPTGGGAEGARRLEFTSPPVIAMYEIKCASVANAVAIQDKLQAEPFEAFTSEINDRLPQGLTVAVTERTSKLVEEVYEEGCLAQDVAYEPIDMDGTGPTVEDTATACQVRCARLKGCWHFSYWAPGKHCHLQDLAAKESYGRHGFVAGPPACGRAKASHPCVERHTMYTPIMPGAGRVFDAKGVGSLREDIESCRVLCAETKGCAHWMVRVDPNLRHCLLADRHAMRTQGIQRALAGPPKCTKVVGQITAWVKNPKSFAERPDVAWDLQKGLAYLSRIDLGSVLVMVTETAGEPPAWLQAKIEAEEPAARRRRLEGEADAGAAAGDAGAAGAPAQPAAWGPVVIEYELVTDSDPATNSNVVVKRINAEDLPSTAAILGARLPHDLKIPKVEMYVTERTVEAVPSLGTEGPSTEEVEELAAAAEAEAASAEAASAAGDAAGAAPVEDSIGNSLLVGDLFAAAAPRALNVLPFLGFLAGGAAVSMASVLAVRCSSRSGLCQRLDRMKSAVQNLDLTYMQDSREPRYSRLEAGSKPPRDACCEDEEGGAGGSPLLAADGAD